MLKDYDGVRQGAYVNPFHHLANHPDSAPGWLAILNHLRHFYGWDARLVGGAVRDTLLGRTTKDWDFSVAVSPVFLAQALQNWVGPQSKIHTFQAYGVVTAKHQGHHITFAACRRDVSSINQRQSKVEFCNDWQADATRRDLTCNAVYFDGQTLWDPFHGVEDLKNKYVRFIGDPHQRVHEDILRFWRFFRFWAYIGNGQEVDLSQHIPKLNMLSAERTQQEVNKLLQGPYASSALKALENIGIHYDKASKQMILPD